MIRRSLAVWALVAYSSFSYSDIISNQSGNAASNGLTWTMTNVLPSETGLVVNGVIYRYTTQKQTEDDMVVNIQNENAISGGYIFRQSDDWSGLPSNTINRVVPLNDIPSAYWGQGEIEVEGTGQVVDPFVVYTYKYQDCSNPLTNPQCPQPLDIINLIGDVSESVINPLDDQYIQDALDNETVLREEEDETLNEEENEEDDERLENALSAVDNALSLATGVSQQAMMQAMARIELITAYTQVTIAGGVYNETISLQDAEISDNREGLRVGLAQQLLHEKMVNSQYNK
jgi:hypothetical protein